MSAVGETTDWRAQIRESLAAFLKVTELAGYPMSSDEVTVEFLPAPHRPPSRLPAEMMAVYAFWGDGGWLKIGKAGPNSNARFTSQHYGFRAPSTLARSLVNAHALHPIVGFDPGAPAEWIKAETHRVNILLPAHRPIEMLSLLEAFLHLRLRPRCEGFTAQRSARPAATGDEPRTRAA